jgi:hypothetical protein
VRALALALLLPVDVHIGLPGRAPGPLESAACFAIAEALANMVKHSGADRAWVQLEYEHGKLVAIVGDNGAGGAGPRAGGGLRGVEQWLVAFDGPVRTSPAQLRDQDAGLHRDQPRASDRIECAGTVPGCGRPRSHRRSRRRLHQPRKTRPEQSSLTKAGPGSHKKHVRGIEPRTIRWHGTFAYKTLTRAQRILDEPDASRR